MVRDSLTPIALERDKETNQDHPTWRHENPIFPAGKVHVPALLPTTTGRNAASALVPKSSARTQWAVRGAIKNVNAEFERLRPDLAHVFPFELDGFQKEAVIHLERVDCACMPQRLPSTPSSSDK